MKNGPGYIGSGGVLPQAVPVCARNLCPGPNTGRISIHVANLTNGKILCASTGLAILQIFRMVHTFGIYSILNQEQ